MVGKKHESPTLYLKFRGVFDHAKLARVIQDWLDENAYEYHAKKYKLKADAAEYDAYGTREISEYATFTVGVHLWARDMKDVEIIKDGEKIKMQEGHINFEIYASTPSTRDPMLRGPPRHEGIDDARSTMSSSTYRRRPGDPRDPRATGYRSSWRHRYIGERIFDS